LSPASFDVYGAMIYRGSHQRQNPGRAQRTVGPLILGLTYFSRSHHGVIHVYDEAGVIETHEHAGDFKEP
jgi:hypothetical protein